MIEDVERSAGLLARDRRSPDLRRHHRVKVSILGRYMLADRREYPCQTVDMSPGGVSLTCAVMGALGERVVLYLEHVGRIEGTIARLIPGGFAVRLNATPRKRDKIASQLTWLANRENLGLPEGRTHERLTPLVTGVVLRLESGREVAARIIDISMSGVALTTASTPAIGVSLMVGRTPGRVVRHFEGGIGVQFMLPISPDLFHEGLTL
ncbi:PilZ domain-containing protein [Methylobacterium sp. Leaf117]|uniref:PilZ domain-containing protein n=1 Tax=Methylobacterium sp. Leaf117 TaxID=1736260 RepID=UPI0006FF09FF|nr:PilZ domain-containing protein [Methylobacterium sp. Leaf117]KQP80538.1 pilus assembly protein PilZ [Methylobacterium sp. Leaf117]